MVKGPLRNITRMKNEERRIMEQSLSSNYVKGEDGEYLEYEIEADSYAEASAKAEMLAADAMVDISYIEAYLIH